MPRIVFPGRLTLKKSLGRIFRWIHIFNRKLYWHSETDWNHSSLIIAQLSWAWLLRILQNITFSWNRHQKATKWTKVRNVRRILLPFLGSLPGSHLCWTTLSSTKHRDNFLQVIHRAKYFHIYSALLQNSSVVFSNSSYLHMF